ncbi:MAG: aspartate ammonia-lyase [Thermoprotei archaeon]
MYRVEKDSLGEINVPINVYYGVQTVRNINNFKITNIKYPDVFIKSYVMIKKACALANMELKVLDEIRGSAIVKACNEILDGKFLDQFVIDAINSGAGTAFNMNVNEVIANRALEILGKQKGDYAYLSPNDHVNMSQSTNDTFPTAAHLALILMIDNLINVLNDLQQALSFKAKEFKGIIKTGRTHHMDAMPITLGMEFGTYSDMIRKNIELLEFAKNELRYVPLGGTAVGTGVNAPKGFKELAVAKLSQISGIKLKHQKNPMYGLQSRTPLTIISSVLKTLALDIIKIDNDIMLMSSGPKTGLNEITVQPVMPGSSIMPGKTNPSIFEAMNMIAYHIIGTDVTVTMATSDGLLELNVYTPVIIFDILFELQMLLNFLPIYIEKGIRGIKANKETCEKHFRTNPSLVTALSPYIGYLKAAEIYKEVLATGKTIEEIVIEKRLMSKRQLKKIFNPNSLLKPSQITEQNK